MVHTFPLGQCGLRETVRPSADDGRAMITMPPATISDRAVVDLPEGTPSFVRPATLTTANICATSHRVTSLHPIAAPPQVVRTRGSGGAPTRRRARAKNKHGAEARGAANREPRACKRSWTPHGLAVRVSICRRDGHGARGGGESIEGGMKKS